MKQSLSQRSQTQVEGCREPDCKPLLDLLTEKPRVSDDAKGTSLLFGKVEALSCHWRPRAYKDSTWGQSQP